MSARGGGGGSMGLRGGGGGSMGARGGARQAIGARACVAGLLAALLVAGLLAAEAARANRLDDAGSALSKPGVWVDPDLDWLVEPARARRLTRRIRAARLPVRIAVLPMLEVDESRGDPRAIARSISARVDRDGLLVLVDEDGRTEFAARKLALKLSAYSIDATADPDAPIDAHLGAIVAAVHSAPAAPPQTFEPYSHPEGVSLSGGDSNEDPLALVALGSAWVGAMLGVALYFIIRALVGLARLVIGRRHA